MAKPLPGQARQNARGDWVDEHGNPMRPPSDSGGRAGFGEVYEDKDGKLRYKGTDELVTPDKPKEKKPTDAPPSRDDFAPGVVGGIAHQKAVKEWEAKQKKGSSMDSGKAKAIGGALGRMFG